MWQYFSSLFGSGKPVDSWIMLFYIDKHGDIMNKPKTKMDRVAADIVENMDKAGQFRVLSYISMLEEDEED